MCYCRTSGDGPGGDGIEGLPCCAPGLPEGAPPRPRATRCARGTTGPRAEGPRRRKRSPGWLAQAQALLRKGEIWLTSRILSIRRSAVDDTSEEALALRKEMLNYRRERERERDKAKLVRAATDQARTRL